MATEAGTKARGRRIAAGAAVALVAIAGAVAASWPPAEVRSELIPAGPDRMPDEVRGPLYFLGDDFGGLSRETIDSHAVPWRLAMAALLLVRRDADPRLRADQQTLRGILSEFGFLFPERIGNWPSGVARPYSPLPLGMTHGRLGLMPGLSVRVANLGCSSCHAGVTYAADGRPRTGEAWLGLPNSSLDLEAYTRSVYQAFRATAHRPDALLGTASTLYPDMSGTEQFVLRWLVLPRVRARLSELGPMGRATPFPNGSPGNTNGVAALKQALHVPLAGGGPGEVGTTSIPDLGHRSWRTSLLYDGSYAVPDRPRMLPMTDERVDARHLRSLAAITTFFTVPSMGVTPDRAGESLGRGEAVMRFVHRYRPPPFPGAIDQAAARRGQGIYARACASCHGIYDGYVDRPKLLTFPNWIGTVGTDPARARLFDRRLVAAVQQSPYRSRIAASATGLYAAPPLTGLWATAPYLHNGSVPTIAALLDPASRPRRFLVGGHRLDWTRLGIALRPSGEYPEAYRPWSRPVWHDTASPGASNSGHAYGAELGGSERLALIEYLKLL